MIKYFVFSYQPEEGRFAQTKSSMLCNVSVKMFKIHAPKDIVFVGVYIEHPISLQARFEYIAAWLKAIAIV